MTAALATTSRSNRESTGVIDVHAPATAALTLLTIVTAVSMCRVFPDWAYLRPMLVVCIGVHATMCTLRLLKAPAWLALPIGLAAVAVLLGLIYFRDSTRLGFPTGDTIDQFRVSMRLVWRQFPHAVSPVPSQGSFAIAATTALALCAWLADSFAFRAYGRAEAVVPAGVVFIFTSALGVDRNRVLVAALWIGAAILTIAALRMAHSRDDSAWMGKRRQSLWSALPAAIACALFATTGAAAVAPNLPGAGAKALLNTRNRDADVTEVVSPLVDIRSRIVNRGNVELFTVDTSTPRYLALASLGSFDGTRWSTLGEDVRPADGVLGTIPIVGETITDQITVSKLGGQLAPAAPTATAATWQGDRNLLWADQSGALYVDGGLQPGYTYQVTSVDNDPSPDQLRAATVSSAPNPVYYDLPKSLPKEIRDLAQEVTADATTPYDQAIALQNWFRTQFQYSLTVQRGHSNDAMINFLSIRKGYCEQFSGTFAAMARALGLPTRRDGRLHPGQQGLRRLVPRRRPARARLGRGLVRRLRLGALRSHAGAWRAGRRGTHRCRPAARDGQRHPRWKGSDSSDSVGADAFHSSSRSPRRSPDRADDPAQPGAEADEQRRFESRLVHHRHRHGDHRLGHRHASRDQSLDAASGQERSRPRDIGVGGSGALIDDGRRTSCRRLDTARICKVGRLRQGRGNRDRSAGDSRRVLASGSR